MAHNLTCNFFRSHVRNRLTSKEENWKGGELPQNAMEAFISLRNSLVSEPIVEYPRKHRTYSLIVDASTVTGEINGGLGAMLCQTDEEGEERVIAYASRQLLKHETITHHFWWKCKPWYGQWIILTPT